jgi:hypothetical protein
LRFTTKAVQQVIPMNKPPRSKTKGGLAELYIEKGAGEKWRQGEQGKQGSRESRGGKLFLLPITYYPLPITHYPLLIITHYLLMITD